MKSKILTLSLVILAALFAVTALFWFAGDTRAAITTDLEGGPKLRLGLNLPGLADAPTITAVQPNSAPNDVDTPIVIQGTGFTATISGTEVITAPAVYLGQKELADVLWGSTTTLSATVPWGLEPNIYSLTVVNPDGISVTLQNAFTVANGIGVFTTGGPYGGYILELQKKPGTPTTIYASASFVGLFISEDAGSEWELVYSGGNGNLTFDAQDSDVLYLGNRGSYGHARSLDGGKTWEAPPEIPYPGQGDSFYVAAHPTVAGRVFVGVGAWHAPLPSGKGGVFRSDDYGLSWITKTNGMTDTQVQAVAINPNDPDEMLAGTFKGNLYKSLDSGESWSLSANFQDSIGGIFFNPYQPLEAWVTGGERVPQATTYLYTSTNLIDWSKVMIEPGAVANWPGFWDVDFLTDTIWVSGSSVYTSSDGGVTWTNPDHASLVVAVTPDNPQEIYAGTELGVDKSVDGGQTWQRINEGLAGQVPTAIATSPMDPDLVFVRTSQNLYRSFNGGHAWQSLDCCGGGGGAAGHLAIDPYTPTRIYLVAPCEDNQFCINISSDSGDNWDIVTTTLPVTYAGLKGGRADVIAPHPLIPGRMLVGSNIQDSGNPDRHFGLIYTSDDYGQSWAYLGPTQPISSIVDITYDTVNPNLIYIATVGTGQWKSTDGGITWGALPPTFVGNIFDEIAPHPTLSGHLILATGGPTNDSYLFSSQDAGETWTQLPGGAGSPLVYVPTFPPTLYAFGILDHSTGQLGLLHSLDNGATWETMEGAPGPTCLASATDGERVIVYIGSPGSLATQAGTQTMSLNVIQSESTIFGGGVYRLTTLLPDNWLYLPIVGR